MKSQAISFKLFVIYKIFPKLAPWCMRAVFYETLELFTVSPLQFTIKLNLDVEKWKSWERKERRRQQSS